MKNKKFEKFSLIAISSLLAIYPLMSVAPAFAEETTTNTTTQEQEIDWSDPNNWYEKWHAEREARRAAAEAELAASSTNTNTGADSSNTSDSTTNNSTDVSVDNDASVNNIATGTTSTGDNDSNKNTGDGVVSSGDASLEGQLESNVNTVNANLTGCTSGCAAISMSDLESENSTTGAGSYNEANSQLNNDSNFDIDNDADLNNTAVLSSDSGGNNTNKNTGNGIITTGDAELVLTAINTANSVNVGYQVFNVMDDQTGDIVIDYGTFTSVPTGSGIIGSSNQNTGADSFNIANSAATNNNTIYVDNNGNLVNDYYLDVNTGGNDANSNTGDGSITTGDANVVLNMINMLNTALVGGGELLLGVVNIFGSLSGDIVLKGLNGEPIDLGTLGLFSGNSTTGADSLNEASSTVNNNTTIGTTNNGTIVNGVNLNATTGDNDASKNTSGGSVQTGDVNANLNLLNIANTSTIGNGGDIWMVLVNNLGTWTGQLFGGPQGSTYSPFFTFTLNPDGSMVASANDTTGSDSMNSATTTVENDTDIIVNNTGTLENNININANTGGNSASKNTGTGTIQTGDVNVAANILNLLNNTFINGNFIVTIVNVFGDFFGNILTEEQKILGTATLPEGESVDLGEVAQNNSSTNNFSGTQKNAVLASVPKTALLGSSSNSEVSNEKDDQKTSLVLGTNTPSNPIERFTADRGLFDGFQLHYLLVPLLLGLSLTTIRRVLIRR